MAKYVIDSAALCRNAEKIKAAAGDAFVFAAIKGDGYGIGAETVVKAVYSRGVTGFCVCTVNEARAVRKVCGEAAVILVIRGVTDEAEVAQLAKLHAIFSLTSQADADSLARLPEESRKQVSAHIVFDCGMGRNGFTEGQEVSAMAAIRTCGVAVTGAYTQFSAFAAAAQTRSQFAAFTAFAQRLKTAGASIAMLHCCNSGALFSYPNMHLDAVRAGGALLGRGSYAAAAGLEKVGMFEARIDEIRDVPRGTRIGYGGGFTAKSDLRTAEIALGRVDGFGTEYGRDLWRLRDSVSRAVHDVIDALKSRKIYVTVNGRRCAVLGHVGMTNAIIDVTNTECAVGDTAIADVSPLLARGEREII